MGKILNGKKVALILEEKIKEEVKKLKEKMLFPRLAVINATNNEASEMYLKMKMKKLKSIGLEVHAHILKETSEKKVIQLIESLNENKNFHGILVQFPLPKFFDKYKIMNSINPLKDVDGLTNINAKELMRGGELYIPCTPKGIISLLDYYNIEVIDKEVVILGKSEIVGRPLAKIMYYKGANVTICDSRTNNLEEEIQKAEILISAVGKARFVKTRMIKKGAVIIDVGINYFKRKIVGDIDYKRVKKKASYITPVPGGVGPMTIISLAENLVMAVKYQNK